MTSVIRRVRVRVRERQQQRQQMGMTTDVMRALLFSWAPFRPRSRLAHDMRARTLAGFGC